MESRDSNDSQSEMISNFDSGSESDEYKDTQILRADSDELFEDSSDGDASAVLESKLSSEIFKAVGGSNTDWVKRHLLQQTKVGSQNSSSSTTTTSGTGGDAEKSSEASQRDSNRISSVGSSQTTQDPLEDTVMFQGFKKRKSSKLVRRESGFANQFRSVLSQEESDRNIKSHFLQHTGHTSSVAARRAFVSDCHATPNKSLVKLSCQFEGEATPFRLLLNPSHFKTGDFSRVTSSKTIEIYKPWNEYTLKSGTRLLFNPSRVKYIS